MKPLVSYYGGNQRIASRIVEVIDTIPHTVYVEPFCGGAAVLFAKPAKHVTNTDDYREVINDHDDRIITLYRVVRTQPDELNRLIQLTPYSQAEYRRTVEILKDPSGYSDLDRAWAYYVNVQQSFSKKLLGGWGTGASSENKAATWANQQDRLPEIFARLREVHISSEDAIDCIQRWDSPHTLFYCDPPYPGAEQGHYSGYSSDDWKRLCDCLDSIQGSYILSNYQQPVEPQSAQRKIEIEAIASSSGAGKVGRRNKRHEMPTADELGDRRRTEILWVCDRSQNARSDLHGLLKYQQTSLLEVTA